MVVNFGLRLLLTGRLRLRRVSCLLRAQVRRPSKANVHVSMSMQADARVFANGEISCAEQLCDGSVANDIPHYAIRMGGLLAFILRLFRHLKYVVDFNVPRVSSNPQI